MFVGAQHRREQRQAREPRASLHGHVRCGLPQASKGKQTRSRFPFRPEKDPFLSEALKRGKGKAEIFLRVPGGSFFSDGGDTWGWTTVQRLRMCMVMSSTCAESAEKLGNQSEDEQNEDCMDVWWI